MLSEADGHTLRMTALANLTSATLPRLSHVVRRLEEKGLVQRTRAPEDGRASNTVLTEAGLATVVAAAPGHVTTVRESVFDALTPEQVTQLRQIADALLPALDPQGRLTALYAPDQDAR